MGRNALADALGLQPGVDFTPRTSASPLAQNRDRADSRIMSCGAAAVHDSLKLRREDFGRSVPMVFSADSAVHNRALRDVQGLVGDIINHHKRLHQLRDPIDRFHLGSAISESIYAMRTSQEGVLGVKAGINGPTEVVTPLDFSRAVKALSSLFREPKLAEDFVDVLKRAHWLGGNYKSALNASQAIAFSSHDIVLRARAGLRTVE